MNKDRLRPSKELLAYLSDNREVPVDLLRELMSYNPYTGDVFWAVDYEGVIRRGRKVGSKLKSRSKTYFAVELRGRTHKLHRLVWAIFHGEYPDSDKVIDHINRDGTDNRISNLKLVTIRENSQNRKRIHDLPLYIYKHRDRFAVRIKTDKMRAYGSYATVPEAIVRRDEIVSELGLEVYEHCNGSSRG